jgi:hypothetical protein
MSIVGCPHKGAALAIAGGYRKLEQGCGMCYFHMWLVTLIWGWWIAHDCSKVGSCSMYVTARAEK